LTPDRRQTKALMRTTTAITTIGQYE
jgi:hypothetical protein